MSSFGRNIKKIRSIKNLSQQAFSEIIGLKRATLGAYEEGRSEPKIETIIKVANIFCISIDDLLTRDLTVNELLKFEDDFSTLETNETIKFTAIPCIVKDTLYQYIIHKNDSSYIKKLPQLFLPFHSKKKYLAYLIDNLEMSNYTKGFFPGDVVIGEFYSVNDISKLINGSLLLVITGDQIYFRRGYSKLDALELVADHFNIDSLIVNKKDIKELWLINHFFKKKIEDMEISINDQIQQLTTELSLIKQKINE